LIVDSPCFTSGQNNFLTNSLFIEGIGSESWLKSFLSTGQIQSNFLDYKMKEDFEPFLFFL